MTKHGFLDKIKNAAASIDTTTKRKPKDDEKNKPSEGWSALKDDFMMNPKKVSESIVSEKFALILLAILTRFIKIESIEMG